MVIRLIFGDITDEHVDVIVNAANESLLGGGGVDGAIHAKGGSSILDECKEIRKKQGICPTGEAVVTGAGRLHAKYVIHAVGPIWHGGAEGEADLLASAYHQSLELAEELQATSISFPAISTGVYNYPLEAAAHIAISTVLSFQAKSVDEVRFVLFSQKAYDLYTRLLK